MSGEATEHIRRHDVDPSSVRELRTEVYLARTTACMSERSPAMIGTRSMSRMCANDLFGQAGNRGAASEFGRVRPNPFIERTCQGPLRAPWPAAHVER